MDIEPVEVMTTLLAIALMALAVTFVTVYTDIVWWHTLLFLGVYNMATGAVRALRKAAL